jgi:hypothetical protein
MCIHHGNWARCVAVSILEVQDTRSVIGKYESCRRDRDKCFFAFRNGNWHATFLPLTGTGIYLVGSSFRENRGGGCSVSWLIRFRCDLRFVVDTMSARSVSTSPWRDQETLAI